jgi:hypothetical protein
MICVLVFLASGSIVYWAAARRSGAAQDFRATATVVEQVPAASGSNAADSLPAFRPEPGAIQEQILSDDSLCRIVASRGPGPLPASTPADLESIRRRVRLNSSPVAAGSRVLTIEYTDADRDRALRLVNELAGRYADAHRAAVTAMLGKADAQAAQAVQQSREQLQQAEAERSEFLRRPPPAQMRIETPKTVPAAAKPRWTDNPLWTKLQREQDDLLRRREELLVKRTPLHPEVLIVDDLIAQSQTKMASVPRRVQASQPAPAKAGLSGKDPVRGENPPPQAAVSAVAGHDSASGEAQAQWNQRRRALDAAVQQAHARLDQALRAQQANRSARRGTAVELQLADRCEAVAAGTPVPWRFLPMVLASGLALATAAGLFFTGLGTDPLVTSAAQLQRCLPGPLLGPVPVPTGSGDGPEVAEAWSVRTLNAWAAALVVVCAIALALAFR